MKKEYKVVSVKLTKNEYETLLKLTNGKPVSAYIKSLINGQDKTAEDEGRVWQNFERKIEALNTNLSVLMNQKQSGLQQSGLPQPGGQGKSPALDYFKSFEAKYFTTIGDIYTLLRDIHANKISPMFVRVTDIQKRIYEELNREPEQKSKKKWFNKEE